MAEHEPLAVLPNDPRRLPITGLHANVGGDESKHAETMVQL